MRNYTKIKQIFLFSSISFLITLISLSIITSPPEGIDLIDSEGSETPELKSSDYWNITTMGIYIDGNWTAANSTWDFINGSGTLDFPFIIENITLDAYQANSCISIANSNEYFIIRNCTLFNSTTTGINGGIILNNVTNGNITDVEIYSNKYGMWINNTQNCTIYDNNIHTNKNDSVYLANSTLNILTDNILYNNDGHGVYFEASDNNTVSYSVIHRNDLYGVYLDANSDQNWVYENYIGYNKYNMVLETIEGVDYNVCYYIIDLGFNNTIFYNDEVGGCTPSPVYGTLPPQEPTDLITIIIIAVFVLAVLISVYVFLSRLQKVRKTNVGSRGKESIASKPEEPKI